MANASFSIAGVYTGCEFRRGGKTYHIENNIKSGNFLVETLACTFMFSTGSNIFVRKSVIEELDGFDESFLRHQDYEFLVRLFQKYNLIALPEILVIKNNENYNLPDVRKMMQIKKTYIDKYMYIINQLSDSEKETIYNAHYIQIAEAAARRKKVRITLQYTKKVSTISFKEYIRLIALYLHSFFK